MCGIEERGRKKTMGVGTKNRLKKLYPQYDFSKVPDNVKQRDKIIVTCKKHGEFTSTPNNLLHGHGCRTCANDELRDKFKISKAEFISRAKAKHGDKYIYDTIDIKNVDTPIIIGCPIHGDFKQTPYKHLIGHGCPRCNASHLETEMRNALKANGIEYIDHCNKRTLKWLGLQHLDFYLPKYNIAIECQGEQHYKPIECFGGQDAFENNLKRDERKRMLCEDNDVMLLYYATTEEAVEDGVTFKDANKLIERIFIGKKDSDEEAK